MPIVYLCMKYAFILLFSFLGFTQAIAQSFTGKLINSSDKTPIANASIYFNNTSIGTVSNVDGKFSFSNLPTSELLLIISCVGYETLQYNVTQNDFGKNIIFELRMKATE